MLGTSVMLHRLFGEPLDLGQFYLEMVESIRLEDDALILQFGDGRKLSLWDGGQSCCEYRYMDTDDDLNAFAGAAFLGAEVRDGPYTEDDRGEVHEQQFLLVTTAKGTFTVCTHNEHNGYYGGFALTGSVD